LDHPDACPMERFIKELWMPLAIEIRDELRYVEARAEAGFAEAERLPPQEKIILWANRCLLLTEKWRGQGRGSLSLVYQALMRMGQYDGIAPYRFEQVPVAWSDDGFVRVLDAEKRAAFYARPKPKPGDPKKPPPVKKKAKARYSAVDAHGELIQNVGESAIANTEISGVMSTRDSKLLILGGLCRNLFLRIIRKRQMRALAAIKEVTKSERVEQVVTVLLLAADDDDSCASPSDCKAGRSLFKRVASGFEAAKDPENEGETNMAYTLATAVVGCGVEPDSCAWATLALRGQVAASFAQIAPDVKVKLQLCIEALVDEKLELNEVDVELSEFVAFCRNNPGSIWKDDQELHKEKLMQVQLSPAFVTVKKKDIQARTKHRFLPVRWKRSVPLQEGQEEGSPELKRKIGQVECSRLRSNAFSYDDQHGLGLCSDTNPTKNALDLRIGGLRKPLSLKNREYVSTRVADPGAKLGNWFMADIEKVACDFVALTPHNPRANHPEGQGGRLPGEAPVIVGQNPRVASSIGATQHTQIATGDAVRWPVLSLLPPDTGWAHAVKLFTLVPTGDHSNINTENTSPLPYHGRDAMKLPLECHIDIVQVGEELDSVFLRVETEEIKQAVHPAVMELLNGARLALLEAFGGRGVDFNIYAAATNCDHSAVLTLGPVSMIGSDKERKVWTNPDTGKTAVDHNLPCHSVDFSQGKGNIHALSKEAWVIALEGRKMMGRLYDFVRKPGARKVLEDYLVANVDDWAPPPPGCAELEVHVHHGMWHTDTFWEEGGERDGGSPPVLLESRESTLEVD